MSEDKKALSTEKDLTQVMLELLTEIQNLSAAVVLLAGWVQPQPHAEPPLTAIEEPQTWHQRAQDFAQSAEAAALAARHDLRIETVAAMAGLNVKAMSKGHRQHIGRILMGAGYSRISGSGGAVDYRKV